MKSKIVIIDYGLGNIKSIYDAFSKFNDKIVISKNVRTIKSSSSIILPGVGSFAKAMQLIKKLNLEKTIINHVKNNKPLLGICLGMQLLFENSEEFGLNNGLSLIPGSVKKLKTSDFEKLPNIGWRKLNKKKINSNFLNSINKFDEFYFLHSFYCIPKKENHTLAETKFGKSKFTSVVNYKNIYGCQFHPEKSGKSGLKIIQNFINISNKY